jgi:hypothetical protein
LYEPGTTSTVDFAYGSMIVAGTGTGSVEDHATTRTLRFDV